MHVLTVGVIGGCLAIRSGSPAFFLMWKRKSVALLNLEAPLQGSATRLYAKLWIETAAATGMEWNSSSSSAARFTAVGKSTSLQAERARAQQQALPSQKLKDSAFA